MEIDRKELKRLAREAMGLASPRFWVVTLVFLLMTTGVSLILDPIANVTIDPKTQFSAVGFFLVILTTLYTTVVTFGYDLWSLWTSRRLEPGLGSLIQGFQVAGRVILVQLQIVLRLLGWGFALGLLLMPVMLVAPTFSVLLLPAVYVVLWAVMLRYALANYLLADQPNDGAAAAVRRSAALMQGWKWELFKLEFSFVGWELINLVLSGLVMAALLRQTGFYQSLTAMDYQNTLLVWETVSSGTLAMVLTNLVTLPLSLWLTPYRSVTRAGFYDARLKLQRDSAPQMPPV